MAITTNIISYWKLDEAAGNAADATGTGNTLTNVGVTFAAAKINNGAVFAAADVTDSLTILDATQVGLDITGDFSFGGWFNNASISASFNIYMCKQGATGNDGYLFGIFDSAGTKHMQLQLGDGVGQDSYDITATINTATYYHIFVTWNSTTKTATFYQNGSSLGTSTKTRTLAANASSFTLGIYNTGGLQFDGTMDEIGIWSRQLTPTEISQLYNSGAGLAYPFNVTVNSHNLTSLGAGS